MIKYLGSQTTLSFFVYFLIDYNWQQRKDKFQVDRPSLQFRISQIYPTGNSLYVAARIYGSQFNIAFRGAKCRANVSTSRNQKSHGSENFDRVHSSHCFSHSSFYHWPYEQKNVPHHIQYRMLSFNGKKTTISIE